ncbi:MAG: hypothetical protein FIB00_16250 [Chloroflexi bacterium]|nr:hypothetical protein [Chloroflexota bacterium]
MTFADAGALVTNASFSVPGSYVLRLSADNGTEQASTTFNVTVEGSPPPNPLDVVYTKRYQVGEGLWKDRTRVLITSWIPHCIDMINRTDLTQGPGGIDNFDEAAKALKGLPHGTHKGYVFSNAWVHQTVEASCIALMIDPQGDQEIIAAQAKMKANLEDWIPRILAACEPDGYLQTAFTLRDPARWSERWSERGRGNHEGYVAGYFIESAINHYELTNGKDLRLYNAAKKLADCWYDNLGPAPKKPWFDGHQEMEQALVRFGRFINDVEGKPKGEKYIRLAKFLLDCRAGGSEYDQSHVPVVQQYEAVGHAVRAVYNYSAMADVAMETRDQDYYSATRSIWDNLVNRKYYVTGGVGSGETSEGFGPDYSLRNNAYCESCSSCGELFLQNKMNRMYHDALYADLLEDSIYNALLGSYDLEGKNFYYQNPLDANVPRYPWHNCPCCVGNIPRTLLMLPTWSYAKSPDSIYVNLFIPTTTVVEKVAGTDVELTQVTNYPWDGKVAISVNPKASKQFSMRIRVPNRAASKLYQCTPDANGIAAISVNGAAVPPKLENGYAVITRAWKKGDRIELELPVQAQRVKADARVAANVGRVALRYGPLLYTIEKDDQDITNAVLPPNAVLTTEWKPDLLRGVVVIKATFANGNAMTAIPYYTRYNRESAKEPPPAPPAQGQRPAPRPPASTVWIREI